MNIYIPACSYFSRALACALVIVLHGCLDQPHTVCPETGRVCGPGYVCTPGGRACVAARSCGNGVVDPDERCDDGNRLAGDGCSSDCQSLEVCGNGVRDYGEACDDGNQLAGDGCSPACRIEKCGNGEVEAPYEQCDDGGNESGDECSADCASNEVCGNGYIDWHLGERCDDGNTQDGDDCASDCRTRQCGDGMLQAGEGCDDGNTEDGDGCDATCLLSGACGNRILDAGEQCDEGGLESALCNADCTFARCGDGVVNQAAGEQCDDTGISAACNADCKLIICGDGTFNPAGEACDDGNTLDGDLCSADCSHTGPLVNLRLLSARARDLGFTPARQNYQAEVALTQDSVSVVATAAYPDMVIEVDGAIVDSALPSHSIPLALGANTISVLARHPPTGFERTYQITVDRAGTIAQAARKKPESIESGDLFGSPLALSASGDTLAVSVVGEDSSATGVDGNHDDNSSTNSGAVYVFRRSGGAWAQQAYIKASNTGAGDDFGVDLTLSASGDTLAVGANLEDSGATGVDGEQADNGAGDSGAVYVFQRVGDTWAQQAYLKASNTGAGDHFGEDVSLSASGDTLAVGARLEDSNATGIDGPQDNNSSGDSGAVYVFERTGGAWAQRAYLKASNTDADDWFSGHLSLSASGDTLAVGAPFEGSNATDIDGPQDNNSAFRSGAVYVFERTGGAWDQRAYIKASNTGAQDLFGVHLSLSASGDTLAVGAYGEDSNAAGIDGDQANNSAPASGAVYVFERTGGAWTQRAYLKASNTDAGDWFGGFLSLSASGNTLAVGASLEDSNATGINGPQDNNNAIDSGAVYVFGLSDGLWAQQAYVKGSNTGAGDHIGRVSLSARGDILTLGARNEDSSDEGNPDDNSAPGSGTIYIFE